MTNYLKVQVFPFITFYVTDVNPLQSQNYGTLKPKEIQRSSNPSYSF